MNFSDKVIQLRYEIDRRLSPLITSDYRILEIPDYYNPGDALIFEGEKNFLSDIRYKCLEKTTMMSFLYRNPSISADDLLIFRGGGYFGDLWTLGSEFQKVVLERYPNNRMLVFPQSVFFSSRHVMEDFARRYGSNRSITICLRDEVSYGIIRDNFDNNCMLIPDLSFYANVKESSGGDGAVLILRKDKEFKKNRIYDDIKSRPGVTISDWPGFERTYPNQRIIDSMGSRLSASHDDAISYDRFVDNEYCRWQIDSAVDFLRPYSSVFSTRLHGGILSMMMGKDTTLIDNSYGKISSLYNSWLSDCDNVAIRY